MRKPFSSLLLLALLAGCGSEKETPAAGAPSAPEAATEAEPTDVVTLSAAERAAAGLRTGRLVGRPLGTGLAVNGTLDVPPESSVSITAPLGGYVQQTTLLQGEHVRRGQVLAVLRNPEFVTLQQDYLETRSRLRYARAELARQRELYEQEVAPLKNYQLAQAQADALQVQTAAQAARLRIAGLPVGGPIQATAPLRAPRAGFVRAVNVAVGQSVTPTEPLFELVDPDHLHVELIVFERDVAQVQKGQLIRFALASDSTSQGFGRTARVYLVGKAIGPRPHGARTRPPGRISGPGPGPAARPLRAGPHRNRPHHRTYPARCGRGTLRGAGLCLRRGSGGALPAGARAVRPPRGRFHRSNPASPTTGFYRIRYGRCLLAAGQAQEYRRGRIAGSGCSGGRITFYSRSRPRALR